MCVGFTYVSFDIFKPTDALYVCVSYGTSVIIFSKSLKNCECSSLLKIAYITPVYKSGEKNSVTSYPISILNIIFSVNTQQHSFYAKWSIESNWVTYSSTLMKHWTLKYN